MALNIPCLFHSCTIRQRLIALNYCAFFFALALVAAYSFQILSLEEQTKTIEAYDDLLSDILELRRYEKDLQLHLGSKNRETMAYYLDRIENRLEKLGNNIDAIAGATSHQEFINHFEQYRKLFNCCHSGNTMPVNDLRVHGKAMAEKATIWVKKEREQLALGFKELLFWLTFVPVVLVIGSMLSMYFQTKNILNRLTFVRKATTDLAKGDFRPIQDNHPANDEISQLINGFNKMATALEEKQEELLQSKKLASIGTFSSGIAHELNNPLNNISLSTDTLLEDFDSMDKEEIREILEDIMTQTERASKIVRNLLDFSRAQAPEMGIIQPAELLRRTSKLIENELRIHQIDFSRHVPDNLPKIRGDFHKLQQVILNLLINARQAIGQDGEISISAAPTEDNRYIRIDIRDNGPGISHENIERIFDPFFTTKEAGKGTGLGLSIVYGIIKKHGGYIEVDSKIGQGTTFSIFLPVASQESSDT